MNVAQFIEAAKTGDLEEVRRMLVLRPELVRMDAGEGDEHRALHYAVMRRDEPMTRLLMQAGADPRQGIWPHRDATTALVLARDRGYDEIVAILDSGAGNPARSRLSAGSPEMEEPAESPIRDAVVSGDAAHVRELVSAHPDLLRRIEHDGGLLTLAVRHGQLEIVRLLLDLGADVDERIVLEHLEEPVASWGMPLWHAALDGRLEIARLLLDRGADPNSNVYASGWPLWNAWRVGHEAVRQLLLERGAKVQPYMVSQAHDVAEAKRLLSQNPGEEVVSELAWSAADNGCPAIVELALAHLNWPRDDQRWHWVLIQPSRSAGPDTADNEGYFRSLEAILRHGVDPNIRRFGATVLHFTAARQGELGEEARARFASMLLDYGARVDLRDDLLKSTPLGWACRWGRRKMAEVLIARGAPVEEPDAEEWATPRAWAKKMGRDEVMMVLGDP